MGARKIVLWGAGGHARVVADIVRASGDYELVGFLDDIPEAPGRTFCGAPVLGIARLPELLQSGVGEAVVAFGNCAGRLDAARRLAALGFDSPVLAHPSAVVSGDATVGHGTVIMPGVVVNAGAVIGAHVILNTACSVDHDCRIDDGAHVAPGVHLAGEVRVGRAAWVGIGSVVAEGRSIGEGALVGAGSVVVADIPANVVAYGVPAAVRRPLNR